jgi:hypothetical protein
VRRFLIAVLVGHGLAFFEAEGVITFGPSDSQRNRTAPPAEFAGSGWELQGFWGNFLGTPIGRRHFITATHVGGFAGEVFMFRGKGYVTTAQYADPETDLSIWSVTEDFPEFAALNPDTGEVGHVAVVFGRGGARGPAVHISGALGLQERGWRWGVQDGVMRWGLNTVEAIVASDDDGSDPQPPDGPHGNLLRLLFNKDAGMDEAHLSAGDSGGGLFIRKGVTWKLAGIHYSVDGPYNTSTNGAGFDAAIYDEGGLYKKMEGDWLMVGDLPGEQAGAFYSTRISKRLSWIKSVLALPVPEPPPVVQFQPALSAPFVNLAEAEIDTKRNIIRIPLVSAFRNYRLKFTRPLTIRNPSVQDGKLQFSYE